MARSSGARPDAAGGRGSNRRRIALAGTGAASSSTAISTPDAVWRAVENLNVDLKMALLLRDIVGLSYTEIADSLEVTLATVKWRIYKAREDVQLALAREGIQFYADEQPAATSSSAPANG